MARPTLSDILAEEDHLGLLDVKLSSSSASTEEERIKQSLEEINSFIDRRGRLPGETEVPSVFEKSLQLRLTALRGNRALAEILAPLDRHQLLGKHMMAPEVTSLDDILAQEDDILSSPADEIFDFKHARPPRGKPEKISERRSCNDFEHFKLLFSQCARDIESGKRQTRKFANEQEITAGEFFILNGVLAYVAEVKDPHIRSGKRNARLRVIFDNGTEGENLLRSLATELYKDPNGRRVVNPDAGPLFSSTVDDGDLQTGLIYVVESMSDEPRIRELSGTLFKIGFTAGAMETRIQNAKDDPTFLMAPVRPVRSYALYNADKVKLENLLHRFFAEVRLDIEVIDRFRKPVRPREWFLVSLSVIEEAVVRLIDGSIVDYRFNSETGLVEPIDT